MRLCLNSPPTVASGQPGALRPPWGTRPLQGKSTLRPAGSSWLLPLNPIHSHVMIRNFSSWPVDGNAIWELWLGGPWRPTSTPGSPALPEAVRDSLNRATSQARGSVCIAWGPENWTWTRRVWIRHGQWAFSTSFAPGDRFNPLQLFRGGRRGATGTPGSGRKKTSHSLKCLQSFIRGCPGSCSSEEFACRCRRCKRCGFNSCLEDPLEEEMA